MNELKFNTTIYYDDYNAFTKAALSKIRPSFPKLFSYFFFGIFSAFFAIFSFEIVRVGIQSNFLPIIITISAMTCLFFLNQAVISKKMKPLPNGAFIGLHEYMLTDEKIIIQKGDHKTSSTYNSIINIVESENNLFLFIDSFSAYIINKKNISSELSLDEITLYLREKCNK
ncbi:MAG: YcxB family protein [Candidatus Pseudothioglobus sp.]